MRTTTSFIHLSTRSQRKETQLTKWRLNGLTPRLNHQRRNSLAQPPLIMLIEQSRTHQTLRPLITVLADQFGSAVQQDRGGGSRCSRRFSTRSIDAVRAFIDPGVPGIMERGSALIHSKSSTIQLIKGSVGMSARHPQASRANLVQPLPSWTDHTCSDFNGGCNFR